MNYGPPGHATGRGAPSDSRSVARHTRKKHFPRHGLAAMPYHAGQRPGARGHNRPHPGRVGVALLHPHPLLCARLVGPLARPFCALRVLPRRGPCPCARPLRRGAPAAASRARSVARLPRAFSALAGPAPRGFPPGSPARGPARGPSPASVPARCRRCPGLALAALRAPCSVALASSRARPLGFASARRVPPAPSAARLRGRLAPAPGACAALRAACLGPLAPGALAARPRLRGLAGGSVAAFPGWGGLSPAPPRPAAPAGGSGGREACSGTCGPPPGCRFSRPSPAAPPGRVGPPVRRFRRG